VEDDRFHPTAGHYTDDISCRASDMRYLRQPGAHARTRTI